MRKSSPQKYVIRATFHRFEIEDLANAIVDNIFETLEDVDDSEVRMTRAEIVELYRDAKVEGVKSLLDGIKSLSEEPRLKVPLWCSEDKKLNPGRHKQFERVKLKDKDD